jgi:hypothetical protein
MLPQKPDDHLVRRIFGQIANLGRIHAAAPSAEAA